MKYTAKQYAKVLLETVATTNPKDTDQILDNFVKVLAENNDLRLFEEIVSEFHRLELQAKNVKELDLTTAHPISKQTEQHILEELNKIVKAKFEVKKQVDERLIGGVVIRMDDQMIDASVKADLNQLKNELAK